MATGGRVVLCGCGGTGTWTQDGNDEDDDDTNEDKTRLAFVHLWKRGGVCLLLVCPNHPWA